MRAVLIAAAALAALTACSENSLNKIEDNGDFVGPKIDVDPQFIQFGELAAEEQEVQSFTITSVGDVDLEVEGISLGDVSADSFTILNSQTSFIMAPGEFQTIDVAFSPLGANLQSGEVIITSNDADARFATVDLEGAGLVPELEIDPSPYDFGEEYVGCPTPGEITLRNVGTDLLEITEIAHVGDGFAFENPNAMPITLEPSDTAIVYVDFDPDIEGSYTGNLTVVSNEPLGVREATQTGIGIYAASYEDTFTVPTNPPSDIIFLADQSCSMDDNNATLRSNFSYFISNLNNYTTNWHVMVVNDDNGCNRSGILTSSTPDYSGRFSTAIMSGGGSYTESLLTPAALAVEQTGSSQCNAGFLRTSAMLHIIAVSDEPEQSSAGWSSLVNRMIAAKGNANLVKVSAIVGDYPSGCSGNGGATAGSGYYEAANYTGGEFLSICASSWSSYMSALAEASVDQDTFELTATPIDYTIEVFVNGAQRSSGWSYDPGSNSVVFNANVPQGGDSIRITYAGAVGCD
ncbi:MAG: choice-of-anchor D domain-containing protein [Alphaproteobacteria bacterium]|nr:choice-of-anchor D domain-containing protein [Alphaproteobacteria bacterium]